MSNHDVIKAWKNPAYRNTLSPAEQAALPANPAGNIEVSDEAFGHVAGGAVRNPPPYTTLCRTQISCTMFQECSNLGCPSWACSIISDCNPILPF